MNRFKYVLISLMASSAVAALGCEDALPEYHDSLWIDEDNSNDPGKAEGGEEEQDPAGDTCVSICTEGEKRCSDNDIFTCQKGENGCLDWLRTKTCEGSTTCNEKTVECSDGCAFLCDDAHQMRCSGNNLEECKTDEKGCGVWVEKEECVDFCDSESLSCVTNCADACEPGAKMCSGKGVAECVTDEAGCSVWGEVTACKTGESCDPDSHTCITKCTSTCKAGDVEDTATTHRICVDVDGKGCMQWEEHKKCDKGQYFDDASKSCKSVCGTNCEKFSIVFLPDTQEFVRNQGAGGTLNKMLNWVKTNAPKDKKNIVAMTHLGDMTDTNDPAAWGWNNDAYAKYIDTINLPYLAATGNHDYLQCANNGSAVDTCPYNRSKTRISSSGKFDKNRFTGKSWYGAHYSTGNSYITFTASGIKFLMIALEFAPRKDTLCWAEKIISQHPDHKVIISTHSYMSSTADTAKRNADGKYVGSGGNFSGGSSDRVINGANAGIYTGANGAEIYYELAARHSNVILMASGHVSSNTFRLNKGHAGNVFGEMLVDYQLEYAKGGACEHTHNDGGAGGGWLRVLTFDPANFTITASTETPLAASDFKNGKKELFCTNYYPSSPTQKPGYTISEKDLANANVTNHAFVVDYDFVTPVKYEKTIAATSGYTHRGVNTISSGDQVDPAISASRTTRDHVVVWADDAYDKNGNDIDGAGNHDIRARVFCEIGCEKVGQFTVNNTTAGDQVDPDVTMDTNGNFVIVWTSKADNSVYMRKFNLAGKQVVAETKVNDGGKASKPAVAIADDGSYVVTWQSATDVLMRGFDANGKERIAQKVVATSKLNSSGKRGAPDIGMTPSGDYVITWEDDADGDTMYDIKARAFKKDGTEKNAEFLVNPNQANQQRNPSIGMGSNGTYYIAWEDDADGNNVYRIRTVGYKSDGSIVQKDTHVSLAGETATHPTVCVDKSGTAYFGWHAKNFTYTNSKEVQTKYADVNVTVSSSGLADLKHKEALVFRISDGSHNEPAVACADNGRRFFAWTDDSDGNGATEIMSRGL